jgi:hypothetical protein
MSFLCCPNTKKVNTDELNNNEPIQNEITKNELSSFMVYGSDFISSIALPDTWNVNMDYARQVGVNGFFYQKKYTVQDSPAAIFLQLAYKPNEETKLEEWIEYDIDSILDYYDGTFVEELDWKIVNKDYKIIVYGLKVGKIGQLQYSSYFDMGLKYFAKIYVSILDEKIHNEVLNDYKKCLENSDFL